ncbi:MAG: thiamine phosphate synthase [Fibrobacterota bacterium]
MEHNIEMDKFRKAGLYLVTGTEQSGGRTTEYIVKEALSAGVRLIQLREKNLDRRTLLYTAEKLSDICHKNDALLIINDYPDIASLSGADGVHLGQNDIPAEYARKLLPEGIIGVSSHSVEESSKIVPGEASYYNIGPIFPTSTKKWDDEFLGPDKIPEISSACPLPFTVMGGINKSNIEKVLEKGARTIAVVSAVTAAPSPGRAAGELLEIIKRFGE